MKKGRINLEKYNSQMENILKKLRQEDQLENDKVLGLMNPIFKELHGCILMDLKNKLDENKIDIQTVLQRYGDRTGYEASRNEVRINDFIEYECEYELKLLGLALSVMDNWEEKLRLEFSTYQFLLILSLSGGAATLRFHRKRSDEDSWLADDLNGYKLEAILVREIGASAINE